MNALITSLSISRNRGFSRDAERTTGCGALAHPT
jgi:hypothetical protein